MTHTELPVPAAAEATESVGRPPWLRRHGVVIAALLLIAVQLSLKAYVLQHAWFAEDDFEFVSRASTHDLSWDYLMRSHVGHLMPGAFALAWALTRIDPYNWDLTWAVTLALQAWASLAMLRVLRLLFGARPLILVPLIVYLFTPMTLPALTWWATALNVVPFQIAILMALGSHIHYVRTGRFRHALAATGWIVFGMAFFLKAAGIPVLLLGLTSAYLVDGPWWRTTLQTLRRHRPAWILYGAVLAAYAVVYLAQRHTSAIESQLPPTLGMTLEFGGRLVVHSFVPSALGGPWEWRSVTTNHAVADSPVVAVVLSALIAIAVVAVSVWYRRNAWRAWVLLLSFVVLFDFAPVAIGRLYAWGPGLGFETRYVADAAPLLALCIGLAFIPLVGEREPYRRPLPSGHVVPATSGVLVGAFLVGSVLSVNAFRAEVHGDRIHAYLDRVQTALRTVPGTMEIHDQKVPRYVMLPDFGDNALASRVLAPVVGLDAKRAMRAKPPYREPMVFDDEGRLRPLDIVGTASEPGPAGGAFQGCWSVTDGPVGVPLKSDPGDGKWWVRIGYIASQPAGVEVQFRDSRVTLVLDKGLHRIYLPLAGGGDRLWFTRLTPSAGICIGDVTVGLPKARAEG